jgi:hypothetical protein
VLSWHQVGEGIVKCGKCQQLLQIKRPKTPRPCKHGKKHTGLGGHQAYIYIYIYIFKNKKKQKTNGLLCSVLCVLCGFQSIQGTNYKDLCTYFGGKAAGGGCDSGSTGHCSMHRAQPILSLSIRQQFIGPDAVHLENKIQQKIKIGIT